MTDRFFEATIPARPSKRFDERIAALYEGMSLVLVDLDGKPVDARSDTRRGVADLRIVVKSNLAYEDNVFGWVRGYRIRQDGERLGIIFEPLARSEGRVEGLYCDLMAGLGVTEVADVTTAWKTSAGLP